MCGRQWSVMEVSVRVPGSLTPVLPCIYLHFTNMGWVSTCGRHTEVTPHEQLTVKGLLTF